MVGNAVTRRQVASVVGEFLGAGVLTLLVLSVQRSNIGVPFFVAASAAVTMAMLYYALGSVQSGFFNPAITLALWTARKLSTLRSLVYIAAQLLGAWGAYYLYTYFVNRTLQPVGGKYSTTILVAEAVGTALFAFGVAAVVYRGVTHASTAAFAGVSLMVGMVAASSASIGLLNPALSLGIRAWVLGTYVLGPVLGAIVGVNLYAMLFADRDAVAAAPAAAKTVTPSKKKTVKRKK